MSYARRFVTLALVVCLVSTSAFGPVGTVAASHGDCGAIDKAVAFVSFAAMYDVWGDESSTDCIESHYDEVVQELEESDAQQTESDIYDAAAGAKGENEAFLTTFDNYLQDTDSVAWMKVEKEVAEAYQNGASASEARTQARNAIADYYAQKQVNLVEKNNVSLGQAETLRSRAVNEAEVPDGFVNMTLDRWHWETYDGINETGTRRLEDVAVNNFSAVETASLVNGSVRDVRAVSFSAYVSELENGTDYRTHDDLRYSIANRNGTLNGAEHEFRWRVQDLYVKPPNENHDNLTMANVMDYRNRFERIQNKNDALQAEAEQFVNATWEDYESGAINASDVISSHTAMWEYGVRSGNESEGLWRSTAALAMMGYDTPNLNQSGTMTVEYLGQNYTGVVMAENAPGGSWEVGKTYDPSTIDGPVFMATTAGEKRDFTDNFTITGMTARDGTQINSTETTKYVYKTANTSQMLKMQEQMTELRQEIEEREQNGVGGDSDGSDLDLSREQLIGVAALAAVALLAGGGRRRAG